ncbi:MAG: subclass B3 metallo-beta-lactamase [Pseudomonadota bacterium]|nr:subclass B3 metallo-beta-lactamase [Pseudomonadota bacterium]
MLKRLLIAVVATILASGPASAANPPAWSQPTAPFKIADGLYYVGTEGLASYLLVTPKGLILLDATLEENVPAIEASIKALGYKLSDVKILLNSHAHFDHAGGFAALKRDTGAKLEVMAQDAWAIDHGKHFGDQNYTGTFPPAKVDIVLQDGSNVALGGVTMHAVLTPGHTAGCTTWQTTIRTAKVIFPCSLSVAGNVLVGNKAYPGIVDDYRKSFKRMAAMDADIVLPPHPELADVLSRRAASKNDRGLIAKMVAVSKADFDAELTKQEAVK